MNIEPLAGFAWRRSSEIITLFDSGASPDGTHKLLDVAAVMVTLSKKWWPHLNANGLIDDAYATLQKVLAPTTVAAPKNDAQA